MSKKKILILVGAIAAAVVVFLILGGWGWIQGVFSPIFNQPENIDFLKIPDGFSISRFADGLTDPRVIVFDSEGRMLVSETSAGRVVMLLDKNSDGKVDDRKNIFEGLDTPHGLAFYTDTASEKTYLYVAQEREVKRYLYNAKKGEVLDKTGENIANLPATGEHFTRTLIFGPNYQTKSILNTLPEVMSEIKLYISVGSSCDACIETSSWKYGAILESDPDGAYTAEFAGGLRNSVFMALHPETNELWATEIGRDGLGDDLPPDEINIVRSGNKKYGWPFCYGDQVKDKTFKYDKITRTDLTDDCSKTERPIIKIPAHSSPLGLAFIVSDKWPSEWKNNLLVAYHGSTQSDTLEGYKVVRFIVDNDGNVSGQEDFISGWLNGDKALGQPVDLKFGPDGDLYISDDAAGAIYKVTRS